MDNQQPQLTEKITGANNILVCVSRNPSVDQLAASIGLTLILNKLGKHATAVFSGSVPSTIEFLQPESTLEKNTDSLRDFIIALDKSKADKLRYKVEDEMVRIFITPYRTSITKDDLEFSQGDFNVDLVIALGVGEQSDLDDAITAHGRILHDATVSSVTVMNNSSLGSVNWHEPQASSLCELIVNLSHGLGQDIMDKQIATALLTGIVAETERFSNAKTSPRTMSSSSELLSAGADQQLVATQLQAPEPEIDQEILDEVPVVSDDAVQDDGAVVAPDMVLPSPVPPADGSLDIAHDEPLIKAQSETMPDTLVDDQPPIEEGPQNNPPLEADKKESSIAEEETNAPAAASSLGLSPGSKLVVDPPTMGGTLTANSTPERLEPALDPLAYQQPMQNQLLSRPAPTDTQSDIIAPSSFTPPPAMWTPPPAGLPTNNTMPAGNSLSPFPEPAVRENLQGMSPPDSSADTEMSTPNLLDARDEVSRALSTAPSSLPPIEALNAQPLGDAIHDLDAVPDLKDLPPTVPYNPPVPVALAPYPPEPTALPFAPSPGSLEAAEASPVINAAPPVPPPIPYRFGNTL